MTWSACHRRRLGVLCVDERIDLKEILTTNGQ